MTQWRSTQRENQGMPTGYCLTACRWVPTFGPQDPDLIPASAGKVNASMQLTVTGKQIDTGAVLRQHVQASLGTILGKYFKTAIEAHVVLSKEAHLTRAEVSIHIGRGIVVNASALAAETQAAFDGAAERIAKQMRRYKRRLRDHHVRVREVFEVGRRASSCCRDEHRPAEPDGRRGGDADGSCQRPGLAVPQPLAWRTQHCLSPPGRQYRVDRSRARPRPADASRRGVNSRLAMEIADLITPRSVVAQLRATNKKQALQELAKRAATMTGIQERMIYDVLIERERLGSTGIGMGIGIPHGRLPGLDTLCGIFARLDRAVSFDAIDDQPVDLIFLLLAPEGAGADHLKALARVSRLLRDRTVCEKLRGTDNADALYALLIDRTPSHAA